MTRVIFVPFELHWFKLSTTFGTVRWVTGKVPRRLHFFGHGAEPIEVHTRKAQQHGDLLPPTLRVYVELFVRKVKQRAEKGPEQTRTSFKKKREERTALEPFPIEKYIR
jgi:hypothetical protein